MEYEWHKCRIPCMSIFFLFISFVGRIFLLRVPNIGMAKHFSLLLLLIDLELVCQSNLVLLIQLLLQNNCDRDRDRAYLCLCLCLCCNCLHFAVFFFLFLLVCCRTFEFRNEQNCMILFAKVIDK